MLLMLQLKPKDLKDSRMEMILSAESKPAKLQMFSELYNAIQQGKLKRVKELIKENENPMDKDVNGDSCLHYAVEFSQFEILKYLIEEVECPPGTEGWNGCTVLHLAALKQESSYGSVSSGVWKVHFRSNSHG